MDSHTIPHCNIDQDTLLIDIATRNVIRLAPEDSVGEAARIMADKRISSIVVTDQHGYPSGIVTERSMLDAMRSECPPDTMLRKIISFPVITVPPSITCLDAYHVFLRDGIRHLVIVSQDLDKLLGVVSETDFRQHINLPTLAGRRQVASVMTRSVFVQPPEASLRDTLNLMHAHRDTCVVVVEDKRPIGIITERDIVRLYSIDPERTNIALSEIMTSPVQTISLKEPINEAAERMLATQLRHLIVVDDMGQIAGLLNEHDLTHTMTLRLIDDKLIAEGAFLHTLVNTIPDLIWLKDVNGIYQACNSRFERFFGASKKNIIGKTDYDFVDRERADALRNHDCLTMAKNSPCINEEWCTYADDGHHELMETINTPMYDNQEKLIGVLGIARDITERRRLEEQLKESVKKFHSIFESVNDCIELISMDGIIMDLNHAGYEWLGYTKAEMQGHSLAEFGAPEYAARVPERMALIKSQGHATFESARLRKDGSVIPIEVSSRVVELDGQTMFLSVSRDITERKRTEQALLESEAKLREQKEFLASILESSLDAFMLMNADGVITIWSSQAEKMFGWARNEVIGRLMHETIVPTRFRKAHVRSLQYFLSGDKGPELNTRIEVSALHRDGHEFPIELSVSLIKTADDYQVSAFIRDISERKHMEQQLMEREGLFHAIFNQSSNGIELIDPETLHFVEVNPAACRMLGYNYEEYLQLYLTDIRADLHEKALVTTVRQMEMSGDTTFENRHRCKNGDILDVEVTARMLDMPGKRLLVGVWRDITERKRAEEALRESEEKLRSLYELSPLGIALTGLDGHYVEFNEAFRHICGYSEEELMALDYWTLTPKKYEAAEALQLESVISTGRYGPYEKEYLRKDGALVPLRLNGVLVTGRDGQKYIWSIVEDITERRRAEEVLRENEAKYRLLFETANDGIFLLDATGFIDCNETGANIYGLTRAGIISRSPASLAPERQPDGRLSTAVADKMIAAALGGESQQFEWRSLRTDGVPLDLEVTLNRIELEGSVCLQAVVRDITERKRAEDNLRITASVFNNSQEAILITDAGNIIIDVNSAFTLITGYSREEVLGRNPKVLSSGRHDKAFYTEMWQSLEQKKAWRGEIWNQRKSGEIYAELLSIATICGEDGRVQRYVGVFSDISYLKEHEAELSRVAHYDALTGIPNRVLLADRMKQAIAKTARERSVVAVCYLDLDGFKTINDNLGHDAGDQVLVEVSRRIRHTIRAGDTVARLGGDEFVVLLELEKGEECVATLERLLTVIAQPITVKDKPQMLSASIGVSIYPQDDEDSDTLLRHADQAMYIAKQSGKNRFYIYDTAMDLRARSHNELVKNIRIGLESKQFELYFQPKINLRTKQLVGAEALIRWRHPERGLLSPIEFLRPVENTELDIEIGNWVIATALEQINYWYCAGLDIEISINISAYHMESPRFTEKLQQQLAHYPNIKPGMLQIEILETAALNDLSIVCEIIEACRKLGVRFALDDFGTGYSSLSYLSKLPVDVLKIDQSFIRDMLEDKGDRAIVQGIIALAQAFDRQTVAEGIETEEHYRVLCDMGCQLGQGYGIARPMPADELINWRAG
ncbi:MAG: PAS domain S-box protein [Methylobacter sp.]